MIHLFIYALIIAIAAVIYRRFLSHEEVLSWWFQYGLKYEKRWFWKPVWGCEFCIAGQIALWTYVLNWVFGVVLRANATFSRLIFALIPEYHFLDWSVFSGVFFVCLTLLLVFVINKLYSWLEK